MLICTSCKTNLTIQIQQNGQAQIVKTCNCDTHVPPIRTPGQPMKPKPNPNTWTTMEKIIDVLTSEIKKVSI